jgi:hypothetical protein
VKAIKHVFGAAIDQTPVFSAVHVPFDSRLIYVGFVAQDRKDAKDLAKLTPPSGIRITKNNSTSNLLSYASRPNLSANRNRYSLDVISSFGAELDKLSKSVDFLMKLP